MNIKHFNLEFDPDQHTYKNTETGEYYAGVTEVVGMMDKGFMAPWAVKEMERCLNAIDPDSVSDMSDKEWDAFVEAAKNRWRDISKQAKESGTEAHDWVERYIKARIKGNEYIPEKPDNREAVNAIRAFIDWENNHHITYYASELVVGSHEHKIGGTLDVLARVDGEYYVLDIKTSKDIYPEYWLQTSAYAECVREAQGTLPSRAMLRLPKDGSPAEFQTEQIPHDLCWNTFLGLREAKRFKAYVKNNQT